MTTGSPDIKLFAVSTCPHCRAVKELLDDYGYEYDVVDVDQLDREQRRKTIQQLKAYNYRLSFPTTVIGPTVVVGNKQDEIKSALQSRKKPAR